MRILQAQVIFSTMRRPARNLAKLMFLGTSALAFNFNQFKVVLLT